VVDRVLVFLGLMLTDLFFAFCMFQVKVKSVLKKFTQPNLGRVWLYFGLSLQQWSNYNRLEVLYAIWESVDMEK